MAMHRSQAVQLELFTNRFRAIAGEMGEMLRRTALSTNVKERLDFSCALLDAEGELVVNAPHIPVHLGALGLCVRRVREHLPIQPGDVIITNHPAFGGSHLPDITLITPVFTPSGKLAGYVANRAHHAEIGGIRPGSMPPAATCLAEEGVVIEPMHLIRAGKPHWQQIRAVLSREPWPSRSIEENLADLRAAVAANERGRLSLLALIDSHGLETVQHYMGALKLHAEKHIRTALLKIGEGRHEATEHLDDGSPLRVVIDIKNGSVTVDFSGSAPVHSGNLNATPAIVRSALMYVLRLLVEEPLPLNEGLLNAVSLHLPVGLLNPEFPHDPFKAPAVVGGNVETSQRLVDTLLKAFGLSACSQGTMNNVLFGNERFGYYETICGGSGAGPGFHGADAVHTHMTNTRITDPEVLELTYPVRVERFSLRKNSGGRGEFRGGDGVVRELHFLENVSLSVLTQHRSVAPYGGNGGDDGASGRQYVRRGDGTIVALQPIDQYDIKAGDRFIIETPGGGGWGPPGETE